MGPEALGEALRDPNGLAFPPIKSTIATVGDIGIKMANEGVVGTNTVQKFTGLGLQELKGKVGQSIKLILDSTNTVVGVEIGEKPTDSYALGEAAYNPEELLPPQTTKIIGVVDGCMEMGDGKIVDRHTIAKYTGLAPDEVKNKLGSEVTFKFDRSNTIVGVTLAV